MQETEKKPSLLYRIIRWLVWVFYPKIQTEGVENLPDEPAILVGNHSQMHGPLACELHSPRLRYTWCAAQMMVLKEVPGYAFSDFWRDKPKSVQWFYHILSYLIAPLAVCLFNNANTIPVYYDMRVMTTFRQTVQRLQEGADVVIFPEKAEKYNHIVYAFQENYVDVAKLYYKRTGKKLSFVPFYIAPKLKKMVYGKPIPFDPSAPIADERQRICSLCAESITALAESLPRHTVIPYRNIPKREYPENLPR